MNSGGSGILKGLLLVLLLFSVIGMVSAATYLPSTKYISIQTEFDKLTVTLEKTARVDFIAHCPDFATGCTGWSIYETDLNQNKTHVTFDVFDKGAYLGVRSPELDIIPEVNLTTLRDKLQFGKNITIRRLNMTAGGIFLEFSLPVKANASIRQAGDAVIILNGLLNETGLKDAQRVQFNDVTLDNEQVELKTDVVAINAENFTSADIKLPKSGFVDTLIKCADWNFNASSCMKWETMDIPFTQDDNFVYFSVDSFSAYGGVELRIFNVQSYPMVGGYWTIRFSTKGTEDLTIEAVNGTHMGIDLVYDSLRCGDQPVDPEVTNDGIFVPNYECNDTGYYKVKVLTTGVHIQKVTFGELYGYAENLANEMPNTVSVEGKLTNSSGDEINGTYNVTFSVYNVASGGTYLWQNKKEMAIDEGIFTAILGTELALNLTWNEPYYIGITVEGDSEMAPRINMTSVPYSKTAERSFNLTCTDCIDEVQINTSGEFTIDGTLNMSSEINMGTAKIINLGDPVAAQDAATRSWVLSQISDGGGVTSGFNVANNNISLINSTDNVNMTIVWINNTAGRVGIGTMEPDHTLHIVSDNDNIADFEGTDHALIRITGTDESEKSLNFNEGSTLKWKIGMDNLPTGGSNDFIIKQTEDGVPEFIIKTSGYVGIGTTSPNTTLAISNGSQAITFDPDTTTPTINTTSSTNLVVTSSGGNVVIKIGT